MDHSLAGVKGTTLHMKVTHADVMWGNLTCTLYILICPYYTLFFFFFFFFCGTKEKGLRGEGGFILNAIGTTNTGLALSPICG